MEELAGRFRIGDGTSAVEVAAPMDLRMAPAERSRRAA
jgi:hypothetical protein